MGRLAGWAFLVLLACGCGERRAAPVGLGVGEPPGVPSFRGSDGKVVAAIYDLGGSPKDFHAFLHGRWLPPYEAGLEGRMRISYITRPYRASDRAMARARARGASMSFHIEPRGEVTGWDLLDPAQRLGML